MNLRNQTLQAEHYYNLVNEGKQLQLAIMMLKPDQDLKNHAHKTDHFIYVEEGEGVLETDWRHIIKAGMASSIAGGVPYRVINESSKNLKFFLITTTDKR